MKTPTKDLFDDSTMSFGEHLEILRTHLIRALIGLVVAVLLCLWQGDRIVDFIRRPIDDALRRYSEVEFTDDAAQMKAGRDHFFSRFFGGSTDAPDPESADTPPAPEEPAATPADTIIVHVDAGELARALHDADPQRFPEAVPSPAPPEETTDSPVPPPARSLSLKLRAPQFAQFQEAADQSQRPVTLNVQEAFMVYLKVSLVAGVILASPWIFYQLWLFVAAGLYAHERQYVHVYGSMSLGLFLAGAAFCFYAVFPFVLGYLLNFNRELRLHPQIRLSEWITFAVTLPLMFGISFQLPLAMLFLERIGIFQVQQYREQKRLAILVIAILSMILTPSDPASMLLMMFPLIFLYFLGIWLCVSLPRAEPAEA